MAVVRHQKITRLDLTGNWTLIPPWGPYPQRLGAKVNEKSRDKGGNIQTDQGTMVKTVQKL